MDYAKRASSGKLNLGELRAFVAELDRAEVADEADVCADVVLGFRAPARVQRIVIEEQK